MGYSLVKTLCWESEGSDKSNIVRGYMFVTWHLLLHASSIINPRTEWGRIHVRWYATQQFNADVFLPKFNMRSLIGCACRLSLFFHRLSELSHLHLPFILTFCLILCASLYMRLDFAELTTSSTAASYVRFTSTSPDSLQIRLSLAYSFSIFHAINPTFVPVHLLIPFFLKSSSPTFILLLARLETTCEVSVSNSQLLLAWNSFVRPGNLIH